MKTTLTLKLRAFPVVLRDERTGETRDDTIVLTKEQLRSMQLISKSFKELIYEICNRQGYRVLDIGRPVKREVEINLEEVHITNPMTGNNEEAEA